jgi:hypothetical protein
VRLTDRLAALLVRVMGHSEPPPVMPHIPPPPRLPVFDTTPPTRTRRRPPPPLPRRDTPTPTLPYGRESETFGDTDPCEPPDSKP